MAEKTDSALVSLAKAGDKSAFDALVIRHQAKLLITINYYINDVSESLDVLQETFIKAYQSIQNFRQDSAFYSWMYRIAVNTAKNHLSHMERRPPQSDFSIFQAELEQPEQMSTEQTQFKYAHQLIKTFKALPKHLQEVLMLREIGGLSYEQIAKSMQTPIGTVRSRIFRARKMLSSGTEFDKHDL